MSSSVCFCFLLSLSDCSYFFFWVCFVLILGVCVVAVDVQVTADGVPVIYHDFTVAELTTNTPLTRLSLVLIDHEKHSISINVFDIIVESQIPDTERIRVPESEAWARVWAETVSQYRQWDPWPSYLPRQGQRLPWCPGPICLSKGHPPGTQNPPQTPSHFILSRTRSTS